MKIKLNSRSSSTPQGIGGKLGISLFFLVFFSMGAAFCGFLIYDIGKTIKTYSWDQTPCSIVSSKVETGSGENPYKPRVTYSYTVNGQQYTSHTVTRSSKGYSDYAKAGKRIAGFKSGQPAGCFVNPDNPSESILIKESFWHFFFILIPLIFVAIGAGGIYGTWKPDRKASSDGSVGVKKAESISGGKSKVSGPAAGAILFGIFLLAGALGTYFLAIRPFMKLQAAKSWTPTECVIESSRVQSHSSDDGTTYSVDILYKYTFNGRTYRCNNYNFSIGSSSGYKGKKRVVNQYPKRSKKTCYVNPADPREAALSTDLSLGLLFGLIPMVFLAVGFTGVIYSLKGLTKTKIAGVDTAEWMPDIKLQQASNGQYLLKPKTSPGGKFAGITIFFIIWSVIVYFMIHATRSGDGPPVFMTVIFALVDVGVFCGVVHSFLGMFNARPTLIVSSATPRIGENIQIAYMLRGKTSNLSNLKITLEGREEATYKRGTKTYTDKTTFQEFSIVDTVDHAEFHTGVTILNIPEDTMHSFKASNNKILWSIKVNAEIARWPDIKEEFDILVLPRES